MKKADLMLNICMVNMCLLEEICEYCEFRENDSCKIIRWGLKDISRYFDDRLIDYLNNVCSANNCFDGSCIFKCNKYDFCNASIVAMMYSSRRLNE